MLLLFLLGLLSCTNLNGNKGQGKIYSDYSKELVPYALFEPDNKIKLHWDLEEISGLAYYKDGLLGAVEDERGKLYILDAETGDIKRKIKFEKVGDYEGVEFINEMAWVMKSNGDFFTFNIRDDQEVIVKKIRSPFSSDNDLEGLGMINNHLLIACKKEGQIDGVKRKGKGIYKMIEQQAEPFLFVKLKELNEFIKNRNHLNKIKDFDPSAIAVHPQNNDIYILSADRVLVVYDSEKKLKEVVKLNSRIYTQPEGICFNPQGVLYISSEGDGDRGELFTFNPLAKDK